MSQCIRVVLPHEKERISLLRSLIARQMNTLYDGWSDAYDAQFDQHTLWFALEKGSQIKAITRLIFPRKGCSLPIEVATKNAYIVRGNESYCEASGLYFRDISDIVTLGYNLARWMCQHNLAQCFTIYDTANHALGRLYARIFRFDDIPGHSGLVFRGFINRATRSEVIWKPMVLKSIATKVHSFRSTHPSIDHIHVAPIDLEDTFGESRGCVQVCASNNTLPS
jgi:hypothetical protein